MLDQLQKSVFHFMKTPQGLDKDNAIWLFMSSYHELTPKPKSSEKVSQWNGNEMKEMSWNMVVVVTQPL